MPGRVHVRLAAAILLVSAFWGAASSAGYFIDRPFLYPPVDHPNALLSARFLSVHEMGLIFAAVVFVLPAAALLSSWLGARGDDVFLRVEATLLEDERAAPLLAAAVSVACAAFVGYALLDHTPLIDDERAYLFQADLFAHFKVGEPAAPDGLRNQMILTHPLWTGKYPPGDALLLVPGVWAGAVHIVHPLVSGATAVGVWGFARDAFGKKQAALAAALWAASPFVWCVDATALSFGPAACALAFALWMAMRFERGVGPAIGLGVAMGALFLVRPAESIAVGAPIAFWTLRRAIRHQAVARFGAVVLGFAALAWVLLWHDHAVTGSAFKLPYELDRYHIGIGFTQAFDGPYKHSPGAACANLVTSLVRIDSWLLGPPACGAVVLVGLARRDASGATGLMRACVIGYVCLHILIPAGGTWDVGPTYSFFVMPLFVVLAARGIHAVREALPADRRALVGWGLVSVATVSLVTVTPLRLARLAALAREVEKPWDAIAASGIGEAAVVVPNARARAAAGFAFGYPYTLPTGEHTTAHLFEPTTRVEYEDVMKRLGPMPVYELSLDKEAFARTGKRAFVVAPFDPRELDPEGAR